MATLVATAIYRYKHFIKTQGDPRVDEWMFMKNPLPLLAIITCYLYFVLAGGKRYMKNQKAYSLKTIIWLYNVLQVISCIWLFYSILTSGWTDRRFSLGCQPVEVSYDPQSMRLASLMWWTMILKLAELTETVFFILRKKNNQVSFLHVYHHVTTLSITWIGARFVPGGMASFQVMPNCLVHVLMYTYYLLAVMGPEWQKRIAKYKPYLTLIQMIQFTILGIHSFQVLLPSCNVPNIYVYIYIPNLFLVFYLFYDFYKKSYRYKVCKN